MADRVNVDIDGLDRTLLFLAQLPGMVTDAARKGAVDASATEAGRIRTRAGATSRQAALAARSVRADRDRILAAAGVGVPAQIFYGAEFGGGGRPRTRQFPTHRGTRGYWFWPTLNADDELILNAFSDALDPIMTRWEN